PGRLTTAFLVLGLALGGPFMFRELPFDRILDEVRTGHAEAGLLIHEGQLTYAAAGLEKSLDLGDWWLDETGMPLPLGVNAVSRAVSLSGVRTPIGRYGGALADVRPDDMAAAVIAEAVARAGVPPDAIEDVWFGAANQAGEDNRNVARMAALLAGLPESVAG